MDYPKSDPTIGLVGGKFTDGNPGAGVAASRDPASWANALTDEVLNVILQAGLVPDEADLAQLKKAIPLLSPGRLMNVQVFAAAGTFTYAATAGTTKVRVKVVGAGGAGGGTPATAAGQISCGGAGGAGGYAESLLTAGFNGASIVIGSGGLAAVNAIGGNGGTSSFGAVVSCAGGFGGVVGTLSSTNSSASSGGGGAATGGNIVNVTGAIGTDGFLTSNAGIGGGVKSVGAQSPLGSVAPSGIANGNGSGGSGGVAFSSAAATAGHAGSPGIVIIEEYE